MRQNLSMIRFRPTCRIVCLVIPLAITLSQSTSAEPAHFWISTSPTDSTGPAAQTIKRAQGSTSTFYIWAQPETVDVTSMSGGNPYSLANQYKELQDLSLNILASSTGLDFVNSGISFYNPALTGMFTQRFQYDYDATPAGSGWTTPANTPSALTSATNGVTGADKITGLQAYSFATNTASTYAGIGPTCVTGNLCVPTSALPNAPPAWLLASISYQVLAPSSDVKINLQIGPSGINHAVGAVTESSSQTLVKFGAGTTTFNASTQRGMYDSSAPDLTIQSCSQTAGDYNGNCTVDAADYTVWRDTLGSTTDLRANGDNTTVGSVGKIDAADYTVWKNNFGTVAIGSGAGSGPLPAGTVPEPTSAVLLSIGLVITLFGRARQIA
jgi:hypothetical protein